MATSNSRAGLTSLAPLGAKMDGLEATRAIKGEVPATRVLVLSAFEDPDHLAEAIKAGAAGYVLKSAPPARIVEAVRKVLLGETPLDQEVSARLLMRLLERSPEEAHGMPEEGIAGGEGSAERRAYPPLPASVGGSLSPREIEMLRLLAQGHTNQQIASELFLSTSTVKKHVHKVIGKLGHRTAPRRPCWPSSWDCSPTSSKREARESACARAAPATAMVLLARPP